MDRHLYPAIAAPGRRSVKGLKGVGVTALFCKSKCITVTYKIENIEKVRTECVTVTYFDGRSYLNTRRGFATTIDMTGFGISIKSVINHGWHVLY